MWLIGLAYAVTVPSIAYVTELTTGSPTYGCRLANLGDMNGDGYEELGVSDCSMRSVTVYYGGAGGLTSGSAITLTGPLASRFGWSLSGDGDLNGDGYADAVVGAPDAGSTRGCVYVFHGGPTLSAAPNAVRCGTRIGERHGGNVTIGGDLDADGYDDLVAAPEYGGTGRLRVYRGTPAGTVGPSLGNHALAGYTGDLGESLRAAGDVDGDGYADVVLGAPYANAEDGSFRVYFGGPVANLASWDQYDAGAGWLWNLGSSTSAAGDVDDDGYDDVVVGGHGLVCVEMYGYGCMNGAAAVFYGGAAGLDTARSGVLLSDAGDDPYAPTMGYSVSAGGDLNADGYPELANSTLNAGCYSGTCWGNVTVGFTSGVEVTWAAWTPDYAVYWGDTRGPMGMSISITGDYNGDGCDDVASTMGNAFVSDGSHVEVHTPTCCTWSGDPEMSPC